MARSSITAVGHGMAGEAVSTTTNREIRGVRRHVLTTISAPRLRSVGCAITPGSRRIAPFQTAEASVVSNASSVAVHTLPGSCVVSSVTVRCQSPT